MISFWSILTFFLNLDNFLILDFGPVLETLKLFL